MGNFFKEWFKLVFLWYFILIDLFGFFMICDVVKKCIMLKVYGVIFNCIGIRVVYLDFVLDYSIESFFMVLCRFVLFRGYLLKIYFDNGV